MAEDTKLLDRLMVTDIPTVKEALNVAVRALMDEGVTADKIYELIAAAIGFAESYQAEEDKGAHSDSPHADYAGYHEMLKATGRKCSVCEAENKLMAGLDSSKLN